jgi:aspartate carbamoyltransferase catalytic subunit
MRDFSREEIIEILDRTEEMKKICRSNLASDKIVASLFFEPSTRTRLSFTSAAHRIGAQVLGFDSPDATSLKKGETLRDTIMMTAAYSDLIVMRHNLDGAARFAGDLSGVPIVNAGDGANEHPSQTMLDLFTIREEKGKIDGLKVAFIGDLKYGRTVHSLTKALSLFDVELYFIAPKLIQLPEDIENELKEKNIKYKLLSDFKEVLQELDVIYMTRIQKERFENPEDYQKVKGSYILNKENILGKCKKDMIILHPLPRVNEIDVDLDDTRHALYFKQAANGIPVRETIMAMALKKIEKNTQTKAKEISRINEKVMCENLKCITHFEKTENKTIERNGKRFCYYCNREIKTI